MAKITFLGNFSVDFSSENHHVKSLEELGHTVVKFQEGSTTIGKVLREAVTSDLFVWVHTHGWETPGQHRIDILQELRESGVLTMTYHLDLWFGLKRQNDLNDDPFYKNIGHFFATDKLMADWFNENTNVKGHFLPAGVFGPECYVHPDYDGTFDYDVIFVGSKGYHPEYPYRPKLVNALRELYGNRFLHVGGDGDTGIIRGDELNRIYARSKVAVGDTLNINFNYPYYSSDRLFESTGRGGFTIYPNILGLDAFFEDKKEIVFYNHGSITDLKEKIGYYIEHDQEREAIRMAGHERAKNEHTYKNRWEAILKELKIK